MKKIAVFFSDGDPMGRPFTIPDYWSSYTELSEVIKAYGSQLYIVRDRASYLGNGIFRKSWKIEDDKLVETGQVTVDVVFNKGRFEEDGSVPVFNCPLVTEICLDKWKMYTELKDLCPLTFYVEKKSELLNTINNLNTSRIVFKPVKGGEGIGIKIENKDYYSDHFEELTYPAIVSDFLDTCVGIPGIVDGLHDLRVAVFDGQILYSYYRTPPANSYLANVSKGGRFEMVSVSKIPEEIVVIVRKIDEKLSTCKHRFYSVDFGCTVDGPKIIEMNSELGLLPNKEDAAFVILKEKLAQALLDM